MEIRIVLAPLMHVLHVGPGAAGEGPHSHGVCDAGPGDEGHRGRRHTLIPVRQAPGQQRQEKVR